MFNINILLECLGSSKCLWLVFEQQHGFLVLLPFHAVLKKSTDGMNTYIQEKLSVVTYVGRILCMEIAKKRLKTRFHIK